MKENSSYCFRSRLRLFSIIKGAVKHEFSFVSFPLFSFKLFFSLVQKFNFPADHESGCKFRWIISFFDSAALFDNPSSWNHWIAWRKDIILLNENKPAIECLLNCTAKRSTSHNYTEKKTLRAALFLYYLPLCMTHLNLRCKLFSRVTKITRLCR